MLPWASPFQGHSQKPGSGFRPTSSRVLGRRSLRRTTDTSESRSASASPRPPDRQAARGGLGTLLGFLHRVDPDHLSLQASGLMCSPCVRVLHYCRLPNPLWKTANPTGVVRTDRRCQASRPGVERCLRALQSLGGDCSNFGVSASDRPPGVSCSFRVFACSGTALTGLAIPLCR